MTDASSKLHALVRSLNLIPYFRSHPEQTPMEVATDLGMSPEELKEAVDRLFCSGVGRNTEDLIDLSFSYREGIQIFNDQGLNKALRLTPTEAGALLLTLEALEATPGLIDAAAVQSAAAKLRGIMDEKTAAIYDSLAHTDPTESEVQATLAEAVERRVKVSFEYWSASSDSLSQRVVDPARIFIVEDEPYLVAWEEANGEHRTFRLDRMREVRLLEEPAQPRLRELDFDPEDPFSMRHALAIELEIHQEFTWLAEQYDIELGEDLGNGYIAATMRGGSLAWFLRFALGQGDRFRVVGPESVVEALADHRKQALAGYTL
ncbi:YafY family protein [Corynebacterium sp.]|uniref:helix-turn-helix transcriptional regulator n=1 Tax=Corynebacterium sp. TaxID=1720 RepID=UPI0026DAF563|nr:WYL domain-containing protein [Corynebacterium sp.]MDO5031595.1 WYL domain-containing protein [Corynebacterium sp.]